MADGYFQTPNLMIPYNDRPEGEIAPIALAQLEEWEAVAREWPVERHTHQSEYSPPRPGWCCAKCDKTIWFVNDPFGKIYQYTPREILALKVAHLRQCHQEVVTT
jgi:hypothetical protein